MKHAKELTSCLACGSEDLTVVLDLNQQPLANNFVSELNTNEDQYPLAVNHCAHCHHLQLTHTVDPEIIYKNYLYVSGTSKTYVDYMGWYANYTVEQYNLFHNKHSSPVSVLDIGCNDGSQLDAFRRLGLTTFGVDPAENLHGVSTQKGHQVVCGFWNEATSNSIGNGTFDIITSQNAFAHIPDPLSYLKLVNSVMHDDSLMFISTSQADMVLNGEFDTIYHEHISFFNANSMRELAERAGLHLVDVVKTPIHGTSYIFVLSKKERNQHVWNTISLERSQGLDRASTYDAWAKGCVDLVTQLKDEVTKYQNEGYVIAGYGAAAKGNTLLNFSKIKMDFIIDDNPLKQGMYTPGMNVPVVDIAHLKQFKSSDKILFVPLAWNFFDEIQKKIKSKRNNTNDKFLKYFPTVRLA